jgi:hypothetical protein
MTYMPKGKPKILFEVMLPDLDVYKSGIRSRGPHRISAYSARQALARVLANEGDVLGAKYSCLYRDLQPKVDRYVKKVVAGPAAEDSGEQVKSPERLVQLTLGFEGMQPQPEARGRMDSDGE